MDKEATPATIEEYYDELKKTPQGRRRIVGELLGSGFDKETIRQLGYWDVFDEAREAARKKE